MKIKSLFLITYMLLAPMLGAQQPPPLREVIETLAAPAAEAAVVLPGNYFLQPETTAAGKMQRGGVLLAAAGRARETNNAARALVLAATAKTWLLSALGDLGGNGMAASQCHYYLGMMAERYEGDLASAESRYQTAVGLNANNTLAKQALARVQFTRNPPPAGQS
jgi:hypothetical protein